MTASAVTPPIPVPAATLLLLRDGAGGLEVLMIERHGKSSFASGALVFPGGRVDPVDAQLARHCPPGLSGDALLTRIAAIRESFEESGVLLARRAGVSTLMTAADLADFQARYLPDKDFLATVAACEIELATDLLPQVAHWITPAREPKRFDTHFFVAVAPEEQIACEDGHEAVEAVWVTPQAALDAGASGARFLMLPTFVMLREFAIYARAADAIEAAKTRQFVTVMPEIIETAEGWTVQMPANSGYDLEGVPPARFRFGKPK